MMNHAHLARIDLNLLVVLADLLETRSTVLTARRLGRTQSAVSHALARLRSLLDDALFVRSGASLKATPFAEGLEERLGVVLAGADALVAPRDPFSPRSLERTFTIGTTDYAEIVFMPALLRRLRKEAPGVDLVAQALGADVERALMSREIDLAYGTRFRVLSGIMEHKVGHEEMLMVVRKGHPALQKRITTASYAALDHVLVTPRGLPGGVVDRALAKIGHQRRVVLRLPHFVAAALIVAQTDLVVTVPASVAHHVRELVKIETRPLPFALAGFTFKLAFSATQKDDPAHVWFRQCVVDAVHASEPRSTR